MLAETVHSFVDCGNQLLLLVGMKRAAAPATKEHPLGHHRELYFWTLVVAGALFIGGGVASCMRAGRRSGILLRWIRSGCWGMSFPAGG